MKINEYTSTNKSFKKRIIFHFGEKAGFYSEYNNMVVAILYCLLNNIRFKMYSADANFRIHKGWNDYFEPFCEETHCIIHHYTNKRGHPKKKGRQTLYRKFNSIFNPGLLITSDLWYTFRSFDKNFDLKQAQTLFPEVENFQQTCKEIINLTYRFNQTTRNEIDHIKSKIGFDGKYIGFHVRGGDKILEHDLLHISEYIKKAEELSETRKGFIYTDDYRLFTLICQQYPTWEFQTLTQPQEDGYFHKQFVKLPAEQRRSKMIQMFAALDLLCESEHAICTYSSNIGMFLGMKKINNVHGLDFDNWLLW